MRFPALLLLLSACADERTRIDPRLKPLADCEGALAHVRSAALADMNKQIDQQIEWFDTGQMCSWVTSF